MADENLELTPEQSALVNGEDNSGGLPSDEVKEESANPWQLSEEYLKDGKALSRFQNADELAKAYQHLERKMSDDANATHNEKQKASETQERSALVNAATNEFTMNSSLSQETVDKLLAAGISEERIELETIKAGQRLNSAHELVGGKDEYNAMLIWGNENLTAEEKNAFDADLGSKASRFAIQGLHAEYALATGQSRNSVRVDRVRGGDTPPVQGGYTSMNEMQKDIAYIRKNPHDKGAVKAYNAKVSKTNQSDLIG